MLGEMLVHGLEGLPIFSFGRYVGEQYVHVPAADHAEIRRAFFREAVLDELAPAFGEVAPSLFGRLEFEHAAADGAHQASVLAHDHRGARASRRAADIGDHGDEHRAEAFPAPVEQDS